MEPLDHPYRPLFVPREPALVEAPRRELRLACGILIAVSAIQILSGAQLVAGALGLAGGIATWRSTWTTSSSSS